MNYLKKFTILRILFVMTALMIFNTYSFSWWLSNGSENSYNNGSGDGLGAPTSPIAQYIAEGAGYFLDSYSCTLQFMTKVELSSQRGMNYPELSQLLDAAIINMEQARYTYKLLKETADNTPYNLDVIDALKKFNYNLYCETNGLNKEIFTGVKSYLSKGNVTGIYGKLLEDMGIMVNLLQSVKKNIDDNLFPAVGAVRQLNHAYSTSLLFGQYVAGVFEAL